MYRHIFSWYVLPKETERIILIYDLVQLHNALIISLFDPSTHKVAAITPPPEVPKGPTRKRRRLLPYQGEDEDLNSDLRSERLKQWVVGVGKRERERIRGLHTLALSTESRPRPETDEIARERGVQLLPERGGAFLFIRLQISTSNLIYLQILREVVHLSSWRLHHEALRSVRSLTG
jgi:hypothetical protein